MSDLDAFNVYQKPPKGYRWLRADEPIHQEGAIYYDNTYKFRPGYGHAWKTGTIAGHWRETFGNGYGWLMKIPEKALTEEEVLQTLQEVIAYTEEKLQTAQKAAKTTQAALDALLSVQRILDSLEETE